MIGGSPPPGRGPSVLLPLAYLILASVAFLVAALGLPWIATELAGHYYHPHLLALTHTIALGWITLAIMGASYQLVPIVLERRIWSARLGRWQLVVLVVGVVGLVAHFWIGQWRGLLWAAGLIGLGALLHLLNIGRSLRRQGDAVRPLGRTLSAGGFVLGLAGLGLTVAFGLTLAANRLGGFLPIDPFAAVAAHFQLALLGWVAPMVVGVAARAYPMFLLAPESGGWQGRVQLWGLAIGAPVLAGSLLAGSARGVVAGAVAVAIALGVHAGCIVGMARGRRRPSLDWGLRFVLTGTAYLAPAIALGLGLVTRVVSGPHVALAYGVLALGGWVSLTIVGMMLKIVPFLVWYRVYAGRAGLELVPTLAQLTWPAMEQAAYLLLAGAPLALAVAVGVAIPVWICTAGTVLAGGAVAFAAALSHVLWHLVPSRAGRAAAAAGARA